MWVYGAWIKRCCVLCWKTIGYNPPLGGEKKTLYQYHISQCHTHFPSFLQITGAQMSVSFRYGIRFISMIRWHRRYDDRQWYVFKIKRQIFSRCSIYPYCDILTHQQYTRGFLSVKFVIDSWDEYRNILVPVNSHVCYICEILLYNRKLIFATYEPIYVVQYAHRITLTL